MRFKKLSKKVAGNTRTWVSEDWLFRIVFKTFPEKYYRLEVQSSVPPPVKGPRSLLHPHWIDVWTYPTLAKARKRAAEWVEENRDWAGSRLYAEFNN